MGQMVKIADLKKFDVYLDNLLGSGQQYMYLGDRWFCPLDRPQESYQLLKMDYSNLEVELLGQMEFIKTEDKIYGDNYSGSASQR